MTKWGRPPLDLTGQRFGQWTVVKKAPSVHRKSMWECRCDCGVVRTLTGGSLTSGHSTRCRSCAASRQRVDKTGEYHGGWRVLRRVPCPAHWKQKTAHWLCRCRCGKEQVLSSASLRTNKHGCRDCSAKAVGRGKRRKRPKRCKWCGRRGPASRRVSGAWHHADVCPACSRMALRNKKKGIPPCRGCGAPLWRRHSHTHPLVCRARCGAVQ